MPFPSGLSSEPVFLRTLRKKQRSFLLAGSRHHPHELTETWHTGASSSRPQLQGTPPARRNPKSPNPGGPLLGERRVPVPCLRGKLSEEGPLGGAPGQPPEGAATQALGEIRQPG